MPVQPAAQRVFNWEETALPLDLETARLEAFRCLQCPAAPCRVACPLHNDIPGALRLIEQGDVLGAADIYRQTSNLPEICGRVCPQEKLCEGHCVVGKNGIPVHIGRLEAFAADTQRRIAGLPRRIVQPSSGHQVAVVGAGPAGLAAAEELAAAGHGVVVYDAWPAPGGILRFGIPSFKLARQVVDEKIEALSAIGVEFVCNARVGEDITLLELRDSFDAIFLAAGAGVGSRLGVDGETLPGVYEATDFLSRTSLRNAELPTVGDRVVVIGAGDTAMDCVRTARRFGAASVTCVYRRTEQEMLGRAAERRYAREEGVEFRLLTAPVRFLAGEDGHLRALLCRQMVMGEPDASGRRRPEPVPNSEFEIACDTAVVAIGYGADPIWQQAHGPETDRWGLVIADAETGATSLPGVFAGGDMVIGPDLVVTAIAAGRRAAAAIDAFLAA